MKLLNIGYNVIQIEDLREPRKDEDGSEKKIKDTPRHV
jgi:hypothetical protein